MLVQNTSMVILWACLGKKMRWRKTKMNGRYALKINRTLLVLREGDSKYTFTLQA